MGINRSAGVVTNAKTKNILKGILKKSSDFHGKKLTEKVTDKIKKTKLGLKDAVVTSSAFEKKLRLKSPKMHANLKKKAQKSNKSKAVFTQVDDSSTFPPSKQTPIKKFVKDMKHKKPKKKPPSKSERRQLRIGNKKHSDVVPFLLLKWESLRQASSPVEKKQQLIEESLEATKGKLVDLCMAHDTSRIVQSYLQYGSEVQRWNIFGELCKSLRDLSKWQFSKHVILKLIVYGAKEHRLECLKAFRGHIARLLRHSHAAEVVELLYNDYATAAQRADLLRELYGERRTGLQVAEKRAKSLQETIALNPDKRRLILTNVNQLLIALVTKGHLKYSIVQHLLVEYLSIIRDTMLRRVPEPEIGVPVSDESHLETEPLRVTVEEEVCSLVATLLEAKIVSMLHTREGLRGGLLVLWLASPKERRLMVKSLKTFILSLARDEQGHLFVMALLDSVDDINLLSKTIIKELLEDLEEVVSHPHARKVLLYALSPRDPRHFPSQLVERVFAPGDSSPHTKKPLGLRVLELRSGPLLTALLDLANSRLTELFLGEPLIHTAPLEDRSRMLLLAEILIRSSAHHLDQRTVLPGYRRAGQTKLTGLPAKAPISSPEDVISLRRSLLSHLIRTTLLPPFEGLAPSPSLSRHHRPLAASTAASKRDLQAERRKRAIAVAETENLKKRRITFEAFTAGVEETEAMEVDPTILPPDQGPVQESGHFLERVEGQLLMRRILQEEKAANSFEFSHLIMELVPPENFRSWLTSNRSCFTLVNLYELGDTRVKMALREHLANCTGVMASSTFPGAKVLLKHIAQVQ